MSRTFDPRNSIHITGGDSDDLRIGVCYISALTMISTVGKFPLVTGKVKAYTPNRNIKNEIMTTDTKHGTLCEARRTHSRVIRYSKIPMHERLIAAMAFDT